MDWWTKVWPIECTSEWKDDREEGWVMMTESGADFPYIVYWLALRTVHTVSHKQMCAARCAVSSGSRCLERRIYELVWKRYKGKS